MKIETNQLSAPEQNFNNKSAHVNYKKQEAKPSLFPEDDVIEIKSLNYENILAVTPDLPGYPP